jgi:16S rRNA (cytosine1402-N4)-methyltransferase
MDPQRAHIPVLYDQVLEGLRLKPEGRYIDATVGTGGHAAGILERSEPNGRLLGLDADREAILFAARALEPFGDRAILHQANFRQLESIATSVGFEAVDGILMDLGLSSRQLDAAERGFAFSKEGPLDMRLDQGKGPSAADLVNQLPEKELADLIWRYGEERHARRIARAIVTNRPFTTTGHLADLIARTIGQSERIHPATRAFQALRIAVNAEMDALAEALPQARDLLLPGGRLVVISFHSLEDRQVKRFFRQEARDCICPPELPICSCEHTATLRTVTRKPIRPSDDEIARNPRSRSARLRIAERLASGRDH